jgi:hypothetical protein
MHCLLSLSALLKPQLVALHKFGHPLLTMPMLSSASYAPQKHLAALQMSGGLRRAALRSMIWLQGYDLAGILGPHSLCASGAMQLKLNGVSDSTIQKNGLLEQQHMAAIFARANIMFDARFILPNGQTGFVLQHRHPSRRLKIDRSQGSLSTHGAEYVAISVNPTLPYPVAISLAGGHPKGSTADARRETNSDSHSGCKQCSQKLRAGPFDTEEDEAE